MALRWRKGGELFCAAKCRPKKDDTYIDDRLHYELAVIQKVLVADKKEEKNGKWYWLHGVCNEGEHPKGARKPVFVRAEF